MANVLTQKRIISDPPIARFLFADTRMAVVWFAVRIYVGWAWLEGGWHKIEAVGASNYIADGAGILTFWKRIAAVPVAPAKPVTTGTAASSSSSSTTTLRSSWARSSPLVRRRWGSV